MTIVPGEPLTCAALPLLCAVLPLSCAAPSLLLSMVTSVKHTSRSSMYRKHRDHQRIAVIDT